MDNEQAAELLRKYNAGKATPEEIKLVENWFIAESAKRETDPIALDYTDVKNRVWAKVASTTSPGKTRQLWPRIAAAASILLFLAAGTYFFAHKTQVPPTVALVKRDIAPGGNKAILTLAGGQQIVLTGARNGALARQGNTAITKAADGQVVYQANKSDQTTAVTYNTITTPRAGKWEITLPDNTHAWLDAVSSIRFPTAFTGRERLVEITGQVYFEVSHDASRPFHVTARGQTVEVLGTHFNINAYPNEPKVRTTLLEGSVRIAHQGRTALLKPGQQAIIDPTNTSAIEIKEVDTEEAIAWKEGYFMFHQADIGGMMRQLERWYDVDVAYEGQTPSAKITGKVHRNVNASQVLKILTYLDIHYKIEGKKIIITP